MAKKGHVIDHDTFMLILASGVVIIAAALLIGWFSGPKPAVEGAKTEYTPNQLMNQLQQTVDDGGQGEILQLKNQTDGL